MVYDSALAQNTINTSNDISKKFVPEEYVNPVYDNVDFGEETVKQTHVTNGIITQKMTAQSDYSLPHSSNSTIINKSQRTVNAPFCVVAEYVFGERKTPAFYKIHEDAQSMLIALKDGAVRIAYQLHLAYVPSKTIHADDENPLPGWTGFNTMLCQEISVVQRVGYFLVINGSPTEYSTIREILVRSRCIVKKLQLKHPVLLFDEAVYSYIQQVRWKEREFYDMVVVRLSEFHSTMSKIFEDGGLKVM